MSKTGLPERIDEKLKSILARDNELLKDLEEARSKIPDEFVRSADYGDLLVLVGYLVGYVDSVEERINNRLSKIEHKLSNL